MAVRRPSPVAVARASAFAQVRGHRRSPLYPCETEENRLNKLATGRSGASTTYEPVGLFDELERFRTRLLETVGMPMATSGGWTAALGDLEETDTDFIVTVEVPGFDADDLTIEQEGRRLMVHAVGGRIRGPATSRIADHAPGTSAHPMHRRAIGRARSRSAPIA